MVCPEFNPLRIFDRDWRLLTLLVCTFGFVKELRPSEAFLTPFLTGPWKNLTEEQVDNEIYPWWTYSYLLWLIPVFLLTDYLRYKPILIVDGLSYVATWALLLWAQGVPAMKLMQVTYGLASAGDIAYFSYLYSKISQDRYKAVTSFTRAAILAGKFVAYLIGQLFTSFSVMDFFGLEAFSFVSVCIAFVLTLLFPPAKYSEIFHRTQEITIPDPDTCRSHRSPNTEVERTLECTSVVDQDDDNIDADIPQRTIQDDQSFTQRHDTVKELFLDGLKFLWSEIRVIYSSKVVILWSLWWALASCGNYQVGNYIQNLWETISPHRDSKKIYNGAVEAAGGLLGTVSVLAVGFIPIDWGIGGRGEVLMTVVCAGNAAVLIVMAHTSSLWLAYVLYVIFRATYQTVITIATAQIAKALRKQRYGVVFGCNMFVALLVETILTAIVVDKAGLGVGVNLQFTVYGCYFAFIAIIFLVVAMVRFQRNGCACTGRNENIYREMPEEF